MKRTKKIFSDFYFGTKNKLYPDDTIKNSAPGKTLYKNYYELPHLLKNTRIANSSFCCNKGGLAF
ncbi:MAG: hypothetical protein HY811_03830 [Planctomycetes bacterium]|nr:hypothetical protein [Planctomycetota bacterium]